MMKHDSVSHPKFIRPIRRAFAALSIVLAIFTSLAAYGDFSVDTSWTYQGQLRRSGAAYNGTCNFQFSLWNVPLGGNQQGNTLSISSVNVADGLFTVVLDFGDLLTGSARWLATSVQCSGDGGFTPLVPRQLLTATPYALSLRPGARIEESSDFGSMLSANNSGAGFGIIGSGKIGLYGSTTLAGGSGVYGQGGAGANSAGVFGLNTNSAAIWGRSTGTGSAIFGENTSTGFAGRFVGPVDVTGALTATSSGGTAVIGKGPTGVYGETTVSNGTGVLGKADTTNSAGVFGLNRDGHAVWGRTTGKGSAIYGESPGGPNFGWAGLFQGPVKIVDQQFGFEVDGGAFIAGNLLVSGFVSKSSGNFVIDHPLDPANKFLSHSFVESPDMMNIYNGNVTTDATGTATVTLPDYFAALNRDYRYQLTVLGQFAQAIVSREIIADNTFAIRTDKPGVKVSWQVTGIRQDVYAKENPIVVEQAKPPGQQGMYLYPAGFGAGKEKQITRLSQPALKPGAQEPPAAGPGDQPSK
jgi:hypothetical protein